MRARIMVVVALLVVSLPQHADAQWRVSRSTNPLDDSTTVVARLDAVQGSGGLFGNEPVRLIARCQSNRTEAYIVWHDYLGLDEQRVTYRFPPATARTETWGLSTDNDSTFVRQAIPFLRIAAENARLVVQTTPYSEPPTTAIFNLAGAEDALAQIAETCEWTLDREQAQRERAEREQAERAERARREAEAQRTLAGLLNTSITTGLAGPIAAGDVGSVAGLRTAAGYVRMVFPAASTAQLARARRSDGYEIICTSGGVSGADLEFRGCTLVAEGERGQAQRERAERERAEREQREQAERAERARREAEAQRTLAGLLNTPITTGLAGPIAAGDVGAVAGLRTAAGYVRMVFPAASTAQLARARRSDGYEIICTSGGVSGADLELRGCTLSE